MLRGSVMENTAGVGKPQSAQEVLHTDVWKPGPRAFSTALLQLLLNGTFQELHIFWPSRVGTGCSAAAFEQARRREGWHRAAFSNAAKSCGSPKLSSRRPATCWLSEVGWCVGKKWFCYCI